MDIGGESTRPYAEPVSCVEELRRVLPVVEQVCAATDRPVSIDTSKSLVAEAALSSGAQIVNDVTGLEGDPQMVGVVLEHHAAVCVMHMQGSPRTMQDHPHYVDLLREIHEYLRDRRDALLAAGVAPGRICIDPGIGFGKTTEHNLALLRHCDHLHKLGCPVLVGPSRKGFLSKVVGDPDTDRTAATIGAALSLARRGVHVLRVHDLRRGPAGVVVFRGHRRPGGLSLTGISPAAFCYGIPSRPGICVPPALPGLFLSGVSTDPTEQRDRHLATHACSGLPAGVLGPRRFWRPV